MHRWPKHLLQLGLVPLETDLKARILGQIVYSGSEIIKYWEWSSKGDRVWKE
jgi:hypothetical protein